MQTLGNIKKSIFMTYCVDDIQDLGSIPAASVRRMLAYNDVAAGMFARKGYRFEKQDLLQSAWVRVAVFAQNERNVVQCPETLLGEAASSVMLNERRAQIRGKGHSVRGSAYDIPLPHTPLIDMNTAKVDERLIMQQAYDNVLKTIARMTPREQEIFQLRFDQELSAREIARQLGISRPLVDRTIRKIKDSVVSCNPFKSSAPARHIA